MIKYSYKIDNSVIETFDVSTIPDGITYTASEVVEEIEDLKPMQLFATMARYEQHKADGWNYYQEFRANLVWEIDNGILTVQQAFLIENYLSVGYDKIAQNGDWMTASYKLKQITLPSAHEFVRPFLNEAIEIIDGYIDMNYPKR